MAARKPSLIDLVQPVEVIELTRQLVALPSQNPPGNESAVARCLGNFLKEAGFKIRYQPIYPKRANLIAELARGSGGPSLLFCGHSDTMPVGGGWNVDPHGGEIRAGLLFGRGAVDMKGGLAAMAVGAAALSRSKKLANGRLILACVIDEENKGIGAIRLVEDGLRADWAVIAEPTGNTPVIVSNGQINFEFLIRGKAGHGSNPASGRSAVLDGLHLVETIQKYADEKLSRRSHPLVGSASVNVGTFHGGLQTSIIPDTCQISVDRRLAPGESVESAIAEMHSILDELGRLYPGLDVQMNIPYCLPPVEVGEDLPLVSALRHSSKAVCGRDPGLAGMRATTDAATLAGKGGIPTVVFGPGNIAQAHKEDEYIAVDELVNAARIFALTAQDLLVNPLLGR